MGLSGYLEIDDIDGESHRVGHEDEIDVHGVHWKIERASSLARFVGRTRARARVDSLTCYKRTDASSPYLALACLQGKSISDAVLTLATDSGAPRLDYLVITMENVMVSGFEMMNDGSDPDDVDVTERLSLMFERVTYKYTVLGEDHAAGAVHEIEYDIAANV